MPAATKTPDGIAGVMARANKSLLKPSGAEGRCYIMSVRLLLAMQQRGLEAVLVEAHWESILNWGNHFGVEQDGLIYDLTLRQFYPDAEVPWIGTVEEWTRALGEYTGSPVSVRHSL